jgi:glycosyltransferase involved in cell wall biosynthesis
VIVVPCYNEAARLDTARLLAFVTCAPDMRLLLVDDGSTDATLRVITELAAQAPEGRIATLALSANGGKAAAVRAGVLTAAAGATYVGYWDADLSTPLDEVPRFVATLEARPELLAVIGTRVKLLGWHVRRSMVRHYLGRVFATAASMALGIAVYDTQCGAKLFRVSPEVRAAFGAPFHTRWVFDVELLARLGELARITGGAPVERTVLELPLDRWEDVRGSKLHPLAMLRAGLSLALVRRLARRDMRAVSENPLAATGEGVRVRPTG